MISHYFTLRSLCDGIRAVCTGAVLRECYSQVKDEMAMTLDTLGGGTRTVVICVGTGPNALFMRDGRGRAKRNSTDIFPSIFGSTISVIAAEEYSRVVRMTAGEYSLRVHLFGNAASNVFLVDSGETVQWALKRGRDLEGTPYGTGKTEREVVAPDDKKRLAVILGDSDGQPEKALKTAFPWLGAVYTRELIFRCGPATPAGTEFAAAAVGHLKGMLEETSRPSPRLYHAGGSGDTLLSVIPLTHAGDPLPGGFPDVNTAVRETFFSRRNRIGFEEERARLLEAAGKDRAKTARSLAQAKSRAEDTSAGELYRRTGTLILTHINSLRRGQTEAELAGGEGEPPLRVRLDRSLTPAGNANRYFDRARKAETAREESSRRVGELSVKLEGIEAWIAALDACDGPAELRDLVAARKRKTPAARAALDTAGGKRLPFRVFPIGENFEAWVGKSSADNDLLTMKYARPHDYWFHVRGASGSHVVLKNRSGAGTQTPREAIRAAARIAAYYSKMRKAGNVPVAYCQRKYVKKPKNAPAGTVSLQREEIIFVTPGIP